MKALLAITLLLALHAIAVRSDMADADAVAERVQATAERSEALADEYRAAEAEAAERSRLARTQHVAQLINAHTGGWN